VEEAGSIVHESESSLLDSSVSRRHACILQDDDGQTVIVDLSSANGTKVDDEGIMRRPISVGCTTHIGDVELASEESDGSEDAMIRYST
jgi:pSer/pThr/pTyr-binding forkhead associated (FHA) protein